MQDCPLSTVKTRLYQGLTRASSSARALRRARADSKTMCEEKELLVSLSLRRLWRTPIARAFETHLRGCADCRDELKALRAVRADLAAWAPPEPDFGFRVVRGGRDAAQRTCVQPMPPAVVARVVDAGRRPRRRGGARARRRRRPSRTSKCTAVPTASRVRTGWSAGAPPAIAPRRPARRRSAPALRDGQRRLRAGGRRRRSSPSSSARLDALEAARRATPACATPRR